MRDTAKVDRLNKEAYQLESTSPSRMLEVAEEARKLAMEINYPTGVAWSNIYICRAHWRLGNLLEADNILTQVLEISSLDTEAAAEAHLIRGIVYAFMRLHDKACHHFQQSLNLSRACGNSAREARLLNNMGFLHGENDDPVNARKYYLECLQATQLLEDRSNEAVVTQNISRTYLETGDAERAVEYSTKALELAKLYNNRHAEALALLGLGTAHTELGNLEIGLALLQQSLEMYRQSGDIIYATRNLLRLHRLYQRQGKYKESIRCLHEALELAGQTNSTLEMHIALKELTKVYETLGDTEQELIYHRMCRDLHERKEKLEKEQRLRSIAVQIAADTSDREKQAYLTLSNALRGKSAELEEAYLTMQAVNEIGQRITATLDPEKVFHLVHQHVQALMPVDAFAMGLYDPVTGMIQYPYLVKRADAGQPQAVGLDDRNSYAASCFNRREGFVIDSIEKDNSGYVEKPYVGTMRSAMYYPLLADHEPIGIITVQSRQERIYTQKTLEVFGMLAAFLSIAIQNARNSEKLQCLNSELDELSNLDGLTGVANRRRLDEYLNHTWYTAQRQNQSVSLILFDMDFAKEYNDHYGHLAGDEAIKKIANTLKEVMKRRTDLVARYGGDEFVLVLSDTDENQALHVAQTVMWRLGECAIPHEASSISKHVTLSAGVATMWPSSSAVPSDLIARADLALYAAKDGGRNQMATYSGL